MNFKIGDLVKVIGCQIIDDEPEHNFKIGSYATVIAFKEKYGITYLECEGYCSNTRGLCRQYVLPNCVAIEDYRG